MVCAIVTFILGYSILTSLVGQLADTNHVLSRALRLGTKIRAWISGLSMLVVFTPAAAVTPDFWCGFIAVSVTNALLKSTGGGVPFDRIEETGASFLPIYTATIIEGLILSGFLFFFAFIAVMILQARDRKKFFQPAPPR
ncbi:MAG: hypothetical protein EOP85_16385 [Verrucomicrobiaceae bacterium]|nr:MAG: hypothetical protein EOP85_16385 [Verrucomicrobiaceae bacterium]